MRSVYSLVSLPLMSFFHINQEHPPTWNIHFIMRRSKKEVPCPLSEPEAQEGKRIRENWEGQVIWSFWEWLGLLTLSWNREKDDAEGWCYYCSEKKWVKCKWASKWTSFYIFHIQEVRNTLSPHFIHTLVMYECIWLYITVSYIGFN